ncbi:MAG: prepilin-type N-terminal cleavage/methylation domain-containing protein [candidate division NC10 bacterium]|nr:prepilin-type N-terminal cleavage/methylation domain-containing protein [candidate division NC10 bacterium]
MRGKERRELRIGGVSGLFQCQGFTLIELLIILAIVGVIAVIAIPTYFGYVQKARETVVIAYLVELQKGQEAYRLDDPSEQYSGDFNALEETGFISKSGQTQVGSTTTGKGKGKGKGLEKTKTAPKSSLEQNRYRFDLTAGTDAAGNSTWNVYAYPTDGTQKVRWFYSDQTGIIRYETGRRPSPSSPPI